MGDIIVSKRYCGPPNSVNGGYCCGLIASQIGPSAKVRLHAPPPLEATLTLVKEEDGVELRDGDTLLGSGSSHELVIDLPKAPSLHEALEAQQRFPAYEGHAFPGCFVCGPDREAGDGLRIFPGPVIQDDWSLLACQWSPNDEFYDESDCVRHEIVWAALDCPSYFAISQDRLPVALLGEIELSIAAEAKRGDSFVIFSWPISSKGRKHIGGAALANAKGEVLAYAKGTWIEIK